jgi:hypothetical protein
LCGRRPQPSDQITSSFSGFSAFFNFFFFVSLFIVHLPLNKNSYSRLFPGARSSLSGRVQSPRDVARRDDQTLTRLFDPPAFLFVFLVFGFFHGFSSCLHPDGCDGPPSPSRLSLIYSRVRMFHPRSSSQTPEHPTNRKNRRSFSQPSYPSVVLSSCDSFPGTFITAGS